VVVDCPLRLQLVDALRTETSPEPSKETAPAKRGKPGPESTGRKVPQIGTSQMWARNPPIPLNSALENPNNGGLF